MKNGIICIRHSNWVEHLPQVGLLYSHWTHCATHIHSTHIPHARFSVSQVKIALKQYTPLLTLFKRLIKIICCLFMSRFISVWPHQALMNEAKRRRVGTIHRLMSWSVSFNNFLALVLIITYFWAFNCTKSTWTCFHLIHNRCILFGRRCRVIFNVDKWQCCWNSIVCFFIQIFW